MFTLIDLFCGAGGMTQGFVSTGRFTPIMAIDFDAAACDTYAANFGSDHVICAPIEQVARFPKADVLIGGPPCQGFSNLGRRDPNDPRNRLWRHYFRAVEQSQPSVLVMENVPEILKSPEIDEFRTHVEALGYRTEARVLNAADYGVPQRRKRAIVVATRSGLPIFPEPTHTDRPNPNASGDLMPWRSVRSAIGDLPAVPTDNDWHLSRNPLASSIERYMTVPEGGNRWDLFRARPDLTPSCWIRKKSGGTDLFGRLWWDRPAFTIRTEFYKPEKGRYLHPSEHRPLTHREAMRLQTFPDSYEWRGSRIEVARQIGNAVPCDLARAIGDTVVRMLTEPGRDRIEHGALARLA
jgi:DNA (cytosine-5)-methyltransferase 1